MAAVATAVLCAVLWLRGGLDRLAGGFFLAVYALYVAAAIAIG